jgi:hypothetical protein
MDSTEPIHDLPRPLREKLHLSHEASAALAQLLGRLAARRWVRLQAKQPRSDQREEFSEVPIDVPGGDV